MKIIFTLVLVLICYHGFAQIGDLLQNPDIEWIAEIELEYDFEPEKLEGSGRYNYQVRKNDFSYCNDNATVTEFIMDLAESGELPVYKTSNDTKQLSGNEIQTLFYYTDTVSLCFAEDSDKSYYIARIRIDPESIDSYIVKQVWYYNSKTKEIANRTLGVSLMLPIYDEKRDIILEEKKVLMYVAFPNFSKKRLHVNLSNVPFVMNTSEYVNIDSFKTLKGDLPKTFEQFFFQLPKSKAIKMYSTESGHCCNQLINQNEYKKIFNASVDSTYSFSSQELVVLENPALKFEDYGKDYKVVQTWYFDATSGQLTSVLNAMAPAKPVLDDNGNFLYHQTLFYLCFSKRDKKVLRR